jgi:hypothetical protein
VLVHYIEITHQFTFSPKLDMSQDVLARFHPHVILAQVRQGSVPATWRIFSKKRGMVGGFFHGSGMILIRSSFFLLKG